MKKINLLAVLALVASLFLTISCEKIDDKIGDLVEIPVEFDYSLGVKYSPSELLGLIPEPLLSMPILFDFPFATEGDIIDLNDEPAFATLKANLEKGTVDINSVTIGVVSILADGAEGSLKNVTLSCYSPATPDVILKEITIDRVIFGEKCTDAKLKEFAISLLKALVNPSNNGKVEVKIAATIETGATLLPGKDLSFDFALEDVKLKIKPFK